MSQHYSFIKSYKLLITDDDEKEIILLPFNVFYRKDF